MGKDYWSMGLAYNGLHRKTQEPVAVYHLGWRNWVDKFPYHYFLII
jgi:hypothetical protein